MKLFTAAQMREADVRAVAAGVSTTELMAAAGLAVARQLIRLFPAATDVLVLCGKGNNGGDGYVVARRLAGATARNQSATPGPLGIIEVTTLELNSTPTTAEAAAARGALIAAGQQPQPLTAATLREWLELHAATPPEQVVIVDALLGSGLNRPLRRDLAALVAQVNESPFKVLAVDVPSGIDADSPRPPGEHVRADATVQLAGPKVASFFHPARAAYSGGRQDPHDHDLIADIGIPGAVLDELSSVTVLDEDACHRWLPRRLPTSHKYEVGTVTVVAGSQRYLGAAELACRGAWRGGAGLVTLVGAELPGYAWPETIHLLRPSAKPSSNPLHSGSEQVAALPAWPPAGLEPRHAAAVVVGPGLDHESLWLLGPLLAWSPNSVVVDATALNPETLLPALAAAPADLKQRLVLTPHAGEAARLLSHLGVAGDHLGDSDHGAQSAGGRDAANVGLADITAADVNADPLAAATTLAAATGAVVVLKGPTTVVARPAGAAAVSSRGHPGMASGGTGDVLAGLIGALTATASSPRELFERTCVAVFVHGVAGERAAARLGDSLISGDVVEELAAVLVALARGA